MNFCRLPASVIHSLTAPVHHSHSALPYYLEISDSAKRPLHLFILFVCFLKEFVILEMWDDEDYEPEPLDAGKVVDDKWDGEDEEDDVKDAWDADSDEEKELSPAGDNEDAEGKAKQVKKKKKLADILKEKEDRKKQEEEDLKKAKERLKELSAEEKAAEKARIKKEQEAADLILARQVFGLDEIDEASLVDAVTPTDSASFTSFREALVTKLRKYENSPHYVTFLDSLVKNLCLQIDVEVVRKISAALAASETEKRKEAKKAKKAGKEKTATTAIAKISKAAAPSKRNADTMGLAGDAGGGGREDNFDDLDDFM